MLIRRLAILLGVANVATGRVEMVLLFGLLGLVSACSQHDAGLPGGGPLFGLRRGLSGEPATLDPAAAADSFSSQVIQDLYEGLTRESPTGEVVPGVAASWTVDPLGTKYVFKLRPDARWSNGKSVRAEDFISSSQRALHPK